MIKLGRNYELTIETVEGTTLTITPPFTLELDITRKTLGSSNVCQLRIYNLSAVNRELIYFNAYNQAVYKQVILKAGYGNNLSQIFSGNISQAWSVREGVNFITQIECYDGGFGFVNGDVNISFPAGTPIKTVIQTLMQSLPHTDVGSIGNFPGVLTKGNTYSGNPAELLFQITGGAFFIDSGKAFALKNSEYRKEIPTFLVNAGTGLLNTPVLEQSIARFEMLFEPALDIDGLVQVDSLTFPKLNGLYKITAIKHHGVISESVSGNLITVGEFFYSKNLTAVESET